MNYYNYFTEVEEHFVKRRGKHLLISPMDWSLVATWRESGVPLHIALRGIDRAMDSFFTRPRRGSAKVNSLFYCHDSVMAEYASYLESRVGAAEPEEAEALPAQGHDAPDSEGPGKKTVLNFLSGRISEINRLRAKHTLEGAVSEVLDRVLSRLAEILRDLEGEDQPDNEALERDLAILDETLVIGLREAVPPEQLIEWEREAQKELKVYRKRLPKETYSKILDNFLRSRLHQWFDLGELSLFHL